MHYFFFENNFGKNTVGAKKFFVNFLYPSLRKTQLFWSHLKKPKASKVGFHHRNNKK